MTDINVKAPSDDYRCNVNLDTTDVSTPEDGVLSFGDCSLRATQSEPSRFTKGQAININITRVREPPSVLDRRKLVSIEGEDVAALTMEYDWDGMFGGEGTLRVTHMEVDESERGKGIGGLLMRIVYEYAEASPSGDIFMTIGGRENTRDFFISSGVPESDVEISNTITKVETNISKIDRR